MSMNVVPSVVTTKLLLVYSSGLLVPYQSLPLPADVLGMPCDLFMFVHHQVYSGHCFCYFFVFMGESSAQPMVTIPLLGTFPWVMVIPRWYHCFTDAPERPRVPLESKLLWLWYVAVVWRWGWKWDELSPPCFILLEVLSYSSILPDSFLFIPLSLLSSECQEDLLNLIQVGQILCHIEDYTFL